MKRLIVKKNRYVDSVSLMSVGEKVKKSTGVQSAEAQMGTPANLELLEELGYTIEEGITPNDLVVAVTGDTEQQLDQAVQLVFDLIDHKVGGEETEVYHSLDEIELNDDPYDLVQISLPGEYAAAEAKKALEKGLEVFIFSDNVSLEEEKELKQLGEEKGLLVMGPDCGVGLINGVALAAGSINKKGPVGIVGASGSGSQEVACIIERCGSGVSSIIGTGGRDLYPQIGGSTMLCGMKRLAEDPETKVIVLVSKLADLAVMDRVLSEADKLEKPVVTVFLGGDETLYKGHRVHGTFSLEEAALEAVKLAEGKVPSIGRSTDEISELVKEEMKKYSPDQKYFRGLYCGGTFTEESLIYFNRHNSGVVIHSNLKNKYAVTLADHLKSEGHSILDLGSEDFTCSAPHPVFDPNIRTKRFQKELEDPETAVILLDFILGPAVHQDPVRPFAEMYKQEMEKQNRYITIIAEVCGSEEDPQKASEQEKLLRDAGFIVASSNFESTKIASALMDALEGRMQA